MEVCIKVDMRLKMWCHLITLAMTFSSLEVPMTVVSKCLTEMIWCMITWRAQASKEKWKRKRTIPIWHWRTTISHARSLQTLAGWTILALFELKCGGQHFNNNSWFKESHYLSFSKIRILIYPFRDKFFTLQIWKLITQIRVMIILSIWIKSKYHYC